MSSALCPPAAAISSARFTFSWPLTSEKSSSSSDSCSKSFRDVHLHRRDFDFAFEKLRRLAQVLNRNDLQAGDDGGFGGVFGGNEHADFAVGLRANRHRQNAFALAHRAGEREFADGDEIVELVGFDLFAGRQHSERDGQIKARPLLFHVGGREVDGRAAHRKFVAGIGERGRDAVARFLDRRVRQTDDDNVFLYSPFKCAMIGA